MSSSKEYTKALIQEQANLCALNANGYKDAQLLSHLSFKLVKCFLLTKQLKMEEFFKTSSIVVSTLSNETILILVNTNVVMDMEAV